MTGDHEFDSGTTSTLDSSPLHEAAIALHERVIVVEGHRDCYEQIYWTNRGETNPVRDRLAERLQQGAVDVVIYAVGGDTIAHSDGRDKKLLVTLETMEGLRRSILEMTPPAELLLRSSDVPAVPDGKVRFVLHLEGGAPLEGSLGALEALYRLGLRSMQPTWNIRNELGDGVHERESAGGLTRFGVQVVRRMIELGMLIDLAHMSETTFWHVARVVDGPFAVTHANARTIWDHPRNLTDDQLKAVAERGGVIGLHTLPNFVGPTGATLDHLVDHAAHIAELVGVAHLGFGGDFVSCDGPRPPREALFHDSRHPPILPGLAEAHELHSLTAALLARGFSTTECAAILGGNFVRLLREVLHE